MTIAYKSQETSWNLKTIKVGTIITSVVLLAGSLFFRSVPLTLGVLAGVILAFINFILLQRIVEKITSETSQKKMLPGLLPLLKFALLALVVFLLLYSKKVDPIGLVIGLSSIVITLALMALAKFFWDDPVKK
jgi:hydrogenase-4 membrane subunit HyfE